MNKQKFKILQSFNNKNNGQHHVKVHISFMAGGGGKGEGAVNFAFYRRLKDTASVYF